MKYLSVCSGVEAATIAWHPLGWEPVGFSEIEKFPSAVLAHHYPDVPNYGDMNDFRKWSVPAFDVLVGGTPCQSFSIAGLRAGLADPRGNLALVYLAMAAEHRPRWLVWENVPGVLSSDGGRAFASIIGGMVKLGYSASWRVLDAQYFGVPQRRRRVFIVASLGDWRDPAQVLFEPESLRRHPPPCREARQNPAPTLAARSSGGGGLGSDFEIDGGLEVDAGHYIPEVCGALSDGAHCGGGLNGQDAYSGRVIAVHGTQDPGTSEIANPLAAKNAGRVNAVAFAQNQRDEVRTIDVAGALAAEPGAKQQTYALMQDLAVRRLTPRECERLQGFPDDFTNIPGASDSARYKALGNSMAVPVMHWIGRRIDEFERRQRCEHSGSAATPGQSAEAS